MLIVKLLFLLLITISAFFYILYIGNFSLILLLIMCIFPIITFISLLITQHSLSASLTVATKSVLKNEPFDVHLTIKNKSVFPIAKAEATIEYTNCFNNSSSYLELHFPVTTRNCQSLSFSLTSQFCGTISIKSAEIKIYDPLRMFKMHIKKCSDTSIVVLPASYEIFGAVTESASCGDESSIYSQFRPGDDPSEVFNLREYIGGDKINRIHWKLSCKKDEFIVKEFSQPIDTSTAIFLNTDFLQSQTIRLSIIDTAIEAFTSISQFLTENERPHTLINFNCKSDSFDEIIIDSQEAMNAAAYKTVKNYSPTHTDNNNPEHFFKSKQYLNYSSFTFITASLNQEIIDTIENNISCDIINIIFIVKDDNHSQSDLSTSNASLIYVPAGRISAFLNEIEL